MNLASNVTVFRGANAISVSGMKGWAGFYLHITGGINAQPFTTLRFAMTTDQPGRRFRVFLYDDGGDLQQSLLLANYGGDPAVGVWKDYILPLNGFGTTANPIIGIAIQDITGKDGSGFMLDDVRFEATSRSEIPEPPLHPSMLTSNFLPIAWLSNNPASG